MVSPRNWTELPRLVPALGTPAAEAPPSKYTLYEEVTEFLRLASAAQPLTLVLEDMQWADAAAWDLLEHVQSRLSNEEKVLICLTVRDDPMRALETDRRARLSRDERLRSMHLNPLSQPEIRIWLESVLDRRDLAPELIAVVQSRAEGNPLLVNQLLRAMLDEHALWHDAMRAGNGACRSTSRCRPARLRSVRAAHRTSGAALAPDPVHGRGDRTPLRRRSHDQRRRLGRRRCARSDRRRYQRGRDRARRRHRGRAVLVLSRIAARRTASRE